MPKRNLRKEAEGRECQIRIPGVCNRDPETTVLCHLNNKGLFMVGTGMKVPDIFAAFGCSDCHYWVDTRFGPEMLLAFYEGVFRTQKILLDEGKIGVIA